MRIALMATCLADTLYPDVAKATVRLLERLGHEVVFPPGQTCCGQVFVHTGYQREALPLVRRYADEVSSHAPVGTAPGSCAGCVRHQHEMLARRAGDDALAARAAAVASRTY